MADDELDVEAMNRENDVYIEKLLESNRKLQAEAAQMREVLEYIKACFWDSVYGKGVTKEYAQSIDEKMKAVLQSAAGSEMLERLRGAEEVCEIVYRDVNLSLVSGDLTAALSRWKEGRG